MKKLIGIIKTDGEPDIISEMIKINELKKELGLTNTEIAGFFGLSPAAYANSSAKPRYEAALCKFYAAVKSKARNWQGEKENKTGEPDNVD